VPSRASGRSATAGECIVTPYIQFQTRSWEALLFVVIVSLTWIHVGG
jgi:hypothetical protein